MNLTFKLFHPILALLGLLAMISSVCHAAFDLNEIPVDDITRDYPQNGKQDLNLESSALKKTAKKGQPIIGRLNPSSYAKVLRLLDILEVCNKDNYDMNKITESFSVQSKAMMALSAIAKLNLIKRSDKPRYNRLMKNCSALLQASQKKIESSTDLFSQMSGETYEDRQARLKESPLDSLRDRFVEGSTVPQQNIESPKESVVKLDSDDAQSIGIKQDLVAGHETIGTKPIVMYNFMS